MPNSTVPHQVASESSGERKEVHLVVARESSAFDYGLLAGMIDQTLRQVLHLPGVTTILEAGLGPVKNPSRYKAVVLSRDGTQAIYFEFEGVHYLYSLGSAAKAILDKEENAFVEILCDVVEAISPTDVHVATFSRLIRSSQWAGRLYATFNDHVRALHCGPTSIVFHTPAAKVMWHTLSLVADMERDMIVARLFAGKLYQYNQGKWILNAEAIPPGFRLDKQGMVQVDEPAVDATRTLLAMMADPTVDARSIVLEAGSRGLTSGTIKRHHGDKATMADLRRPHSRVRSLIDWLPTYSTGRVGIRWPTPFKGATRFGPLPVYQDPKGNEYVEFTYDWPLPDGGFGDAAVLAAAATRTKGLREARTASNRAGRRGRSKKPLAGWLWEAGTQRFKLVSSQQNYRVLRQTTQADES